MEMTSSEIIMHLKANGDESMMNELQELFMTADLVKFAKYSSLLNEKDMNLVNAITSSTRRSATTFRLRRRLCLR